jgi:ATP-dependent Clp protease ATP-binding subunit ClpB
LTEAVRRKPYSIILLDEIEKAHPDVFNILLQVLDDGRLTDNKGRVVNFKNTIIIMTSNFGSAQIHEQFDGIKQEEFERVHAKTKLLIDELLRQTIRPEFLNRIDETLLFTPLNEEHIDEIVRIQLGKLQSTMIAKGYEFTFTEDAIKWVAKEGYDPFFGARPVKRVIQKQVLNALSKSLLSDTFENSKRVVMDVFDGLVVFRQPLSEKIEQ